MPDHWRPFKANFWDQEDVKVVKLDEECIEQQRKAYPGEIIPEKAISMTIPAIMRAGTIVSLVPGLEKAQAVYDVLTGKISEACPASILRVHDNAFLFLDLNSASLLLKILIAIDLSY
jgi:glucosamine-6-phosphate deaminase